MFSAGAFFKFLFGWLFLGLVLQPYSLPLQQLRNMKPTGSSSGNKAKTIVWSRFRIRSGNLEKSERWVMNTANIWIVMFGIEIEPVFRWTRNNSKGWINCLKGIQVQNTQVHVNSSRKDKDGMWGWSRIVGILRPIDVRFKDVSTLNPTCLSTPTLWTLIV